MLLLPILSVLAMILFHSANTQDGIMVFSRSYNNRLAEEEIVMSKRADGPFPAQNWIKDEVWKPVGRHTGAASTMRLKFSHEYHKYLCLLAIEERERETRRGQIWFQNQLTMPQIQQICSEKPASPGLSSNLEKPKKYRPAMGISYGRG